VANFIGLDLHRAQITYHALDVETGEVRTGRIRPANRQTIRESLERMTADGQDVVVAVEAMTGWRFVVEECVRVGAEVRLAEPAETRLNQDRTASRGDRQGRRAAAARDARRRPAAAVVDRARAHP